MKVIKKINNNVVLCLDSSGKEVVAFGKGIGFLDSPSELELSRIQRAFYNIDPSYLKMINEIRPEIVDISAKVVDYARISLDYALNPNVVITLADHINFAIDRFQKNMHINLPLVEDVQYIYEKENRCGVMALELLKKELKIFLPEAEAQYIALHLLNAEYVSEPKKEEKLDGEIVEDIVKIVEDSFGFKVDRDTFDYSRFVSHMHYLLKRGDNQMVSSNEKLFETLVKTYPESLKCAKRINEYFVENKRFMLNDEELCYLIIHINRLCSHLG